MNEDGEMMRIKKGNEREELVLSGGRWKKVKKEKIESIVEMKK